MSPRSQNILISKLVDLFRPVSEKVFEERLLELQVGAAVVERISPITYEPFTVGVEPGEPLPKSPDFAIRLPEMYYVIEVTRLRLGFLEDWNAAAQELARKLQNRILRTEGLRRFVEFSAPISASRRDFERLVTKDIIRQVVQSPSGSVTVPVSLGEATISWAISDSMFHVNPDIEASVLGVSYHATYQDEEDQEERIIKSIRATLKDKRKQLTASVPYLLAIRVDEVNNMAVSQRLFSRIFPNNDYSWISGLLLYVPASNWEQGAQKAVLTLHANENARYRVSDTLHRIFNEEGVGFHIPPQSLSESTEPDEA
jgi:hypothetical protein